MLIPGEEANGSPHAIALGGTDSIVQGANRPGSEIAHIQQSIWDVHSQGGVWSIAHPDDGETNDDGTPNARASVQGVDLVEFWNHASDIEKEIAYAENRWNAGFRFGIAGASDSHFREYWDWQGPSLPTTRVLAGAYNDRGVLEGLRAGRTSLSWYAGGPKVTLTADMGRAHGVGGDELFVKAGTKGRLRITLERGAGMKVLLYKSPGRSAGPLRTFSPAKATETWTVDITAGAQPEWYRVEVRRPTPADPNNRRDTDLMAAASPIFISPDPVTARGEVALPPDQGQNDGAALAFGQQGAFAGFPDVAQELSVPHLVAETHGPASSTVVYRREDERGRLGPAVTLSGKGLARYPKVAALGRQVWVVWQEDAAQVPHRPAIQLRHSTDGGKSWGKTATVRAIGGRAEHPDIAIAVNGRPIVVWQEIEAGQPFDVMLQEVGSGAPPRNLSRAGKVIREADADDTRSARYPASVWPAVAAAQDGRIAVAWQDNRTDPDPLWTGSELAAGTNPDNWQIQIAVRGSGGAWNAVTSLGADDRADRHPDVAFAGQGQLVVVWETRPLNAAGQNLSILSAVSANGAPFRPAAPVGLDPRAMSQWPRLGLDADKSVRAVWYDSRSADWRWRVTTALLRDGTWTDARVINARGINTWPATAGGRIVFAGTRNAARMQRDQTQQVFVLRP